VERVHGAFISDEEVQSVVDFLRAQGEPEYNEMILSEREEDSDEEGGQESEEYDEFYDQAVQIVTSTKQASISMLQRKLRVGYNRAARMIEKMEQEGIVGPSDGSKPREVLVSTY
jgi:S-DNA-T family DNA segregation ATPase FtsK/SpoIIIE